MPEEIGYQRLLDYAIGGSIKEVENMLKKDGSLVNKKDELGDSLLHHISGSGNHVVVEVLLRNGADVNAVGKDNATALHFAVLMGHVSVVEALLKKGANINAQDKEGNTPLIIAVQKDQFAIIKILLDAKATLHIRNNKNEHAHMIAYKNAQDKDEPRNTLAHKENTELLRQAFMSEGLFYYSKRGDVESVRKLIEKGGAKVDAKKIDDYGNNAFHLAGMKNPEILELLTKKATRGDLDVLNKNNWTVLHIAVSKNNSEMIDNLLKRGANPNVLGGKNQLTALGVAIQYGIVKAFKEILKVSNGVANFSIPEGPNKDRVPTDIIFSSQNTDIVKIEMIALLLNSFPSGTKMKVEYINNLEKDGIISEALKEYFMHLKEYYEDCYKGNKEFKVDDFLKQIDERESAIKNLLHFKNPQSSGDSGYDADESRSPSPSPRPEKRSRSENKESLKQIKGNLEN